MGDDVTCMCYERALVVARELVALQLPFDDGWDIRDACQRLSNLIKYDHTWTKGSSNYLSLIAFVDRIKVRTWGSTICGQWPSGHLENRMAELYFCLNGAEV